MALRAREHVVVDACGYKVTTADVSTTEGSLGAAKSFHETARETQDGAVFKLEADIISPQQRELIASAVHVPSQMTPAVIEPETDSMLHCSESVLDMAEGV